MSIPFGHKIGYDSGVADGGGAVGLNGREWLVVVGGGSCSSEE
jgi:hypothetical protein